MLIKALNEYYDILARMTRFARTVFQNRISRI